MNINIKTEIFAPGSQAVQAAKILGWERHRVIGALADLWHNSQASEAIQGDQAAIGLWSTLRRAEDQRRFIAALTLCSFLVDLGVQDGVNQWLIVGNEKHVNIKRNISKAQSLRASKKWADERKKLEEPMPAASPLASSAISAISAMQREREGHETTKPLALAREAAATEFDKRSEIQPPTPTSPQLPPQTDSLREITESQVDTKTANEIFADYQAAREKRRQIAGAIFHNGTDIALCKTLYVLAAGDRVLLKHVIRAYLEQDGAKGYFKNQRWALRILAEPRNFDLCRSIAGERLLQKKAPSA